MSLRRRKTRAVIRGADTLGMSERTIYAIAVLAALILALTPSLAAEHSTVRASEPIESSTISSTDIASGDSEQLPVSEGFASWYGGRFQGRQTANGEIFDTNAFTAAHRTLPFHTRVRVTNTTNGRSVVVRINDRGPFVDGRIIDLSRAAAEQLEMVSAGVAPVRVEVLSMGATSDTVTIQVAAFRNPDYAQRLVVTLDEGGIAAGTERSESGVIRVVLRGVARTDVARYRQWLSDLGHPDVLVRAESR